MKAKIIILLFAVLIPLPALAVEYYVSPSGSGTTCSQVSPCAVSYVMGQLAAGDTCYFLDGTYSSPDTGGYNDPGIHPEASGTSGSPIVLKSLNQHGAVLTKANGASHQSPLIGSGDKDTYNNDYIRIEDFDVRGAIGLVYTTGSRATRNDVSVCGFDDTGNATFGACVFLEETNSTLISNNRLHDNGTIGIGGWNNGLIILYYDQGSVIEKNTFDNIDQSWGNDDTTAVYFKDAPGYNNNPTVFRQNFISGGMLLGPIQNQTSKSTPSLSIYQNVLIGDRGFIMHKGEGIRLPTALVYNNTQYSTTRGFVLDSNTATGLQYFNNIVHTDTRTFICWGDNDGFIGDSPYWDNNKYSNTQYWQMVGSDYSSFSAWQSGSGDDQNSTYGSITFANAGGTDPEDYKVSGGAPSGGRGGSYSSSLGAYITGNEQVGHDWGGDSTAPTVTVFVIPATSTSLTVSITTFTDTDDTAVTGRCVNESATTPTEGACSGSGWEASAQTQYVFSTEGAKTLYAWAKDAAGNISTSLNDSVTITFPTATVTQGGGIIGGTSR